MVDYLERAVVHPKKPRKFTTTMEAQQTVARLVGIPPDRWRSATTLQARKLDIGQRQQVVGWRDRDVCPSEECWRRKARDRGASVARCHRGRMCLRRDLWGALSHATWTRAQESVGCKGEEGMWAPGAI